MSGIDGNLVDEVERQISFLYLAYTLAASLVVYIAWRSTYVRDFNQLDLYRSRTLFILNPQTGVFERHPIVLQPQDSNATTTSDQNDLDGDNLTAAEADANIVRIPAPPPTLESILDEVSGFATSAHYNPSAQLDSDVVEEEAQAIIREMDGGAHTQEGLRQRRIAFFDNATSSNRSNAPTSSTSPTTAVSTPITTTVTPTVVPIPSTSAANLEQPIASHDVPIKQFPVVEQYTGKDETDTGITSATNSTASIVNPGSPVEDILFGDELTIKLKYLNDDLKIVKGRPSELIGDFKKRNFSVELAAQKLVRLVFNGHVLQPDTKTLTACGLFDNCVVHCLIHNPRPGTNTAQNQPTDNPPVQTINEDGTEQIGLENLINADRNRSRNTQRLLHLSLLLICLSVIISWFFRIQYFQLFTWYSTVGLVLLTTFFLVIIPLIFLIEREIFRNL